MFISPSTLCRRFFTATMLSAFSLPLSAESLLPANTATTINQAANGVPIVNIAKPDANGLSHNRYTKFDVKKQGLIFNNSQGVTNTQLGGYVPANPQLVKPATLILNEVTSANPSQLNGYMEVAGSKAGVVVANPWGISCDGCGFINTNHATLATGTPLFDNYGQLSGFAMGQGSLTLEGQGLNASNTDRTAFYTRALLLNAELHASDLTIATGSRELDLEGNVLSAHSGTASGAAPEFSIDSSVLGGMYANTIRLIGTEAGVGMRLGAPVAAFTGQMSISANGDVRMVEASSATNMRIQGNRITPAGSLSAGDNLKLEASEALALNQRLEAQGQIQLNAPTVHIADNNVVAAQQQLTVQADSLRNRGLLYGRTGIKLILEDWLENGVAESLNDASQYRFAALLSDGDIAITNALDNRLLRVSNYGSLIESREGQLTIKAQQLDNLNIGWALAPSRNEASVTTYNPSKALFDTFYNQGISGDSYKQAYRYVSTLTVNDILSSGHAGFLLAQNAMLNADQFNNDHGFISASDRLFIQADILKNIGTQIFDEENIATTVRWHVCKKHTNQNTTCNAAESILPLNSQNGGQPLLHNPRVLASVIEGHGGIQITLGGALQNGNQTESLLQNVGNTPRPTDISLSPLESGLFHKTPPGHPYLIETDPAINTYQGFLGSAYLLSQLNWKPEITQKRLGDSYYELSLIRESLLVQTGSRFLDPAIADEKAQYEFLMQNAIAASESLQLSLGVALSREQIDALQQDMVWLESRTIDNEEVLVPVVYLAQNSPRLLTNGAIIGGGSLLVEADTVNNSGALSSAGTMIISTTGNIHNLAGQWQAGGDLSVQSGGDILNESGHISGLNVSLQAAGDITHRTASSLQETQGSGAHTWATQVGDTASVTARGDQVQIAGGNLTLQGASVSGNNVSLTAANHVIFDAVEKRSGQQLNMEDWSHLEEEVYYLQSQVEAAQNLSLQAANSLVAIAAKLEAGGDMGLSAGNSISLLAANETSNTESHIYSGRIESHSKDYSNTWLGTDVKAGGSLVVKAGGDISAYASRLQAAKTGTVISGGDILLQAAVNETESSRSHTKKGTTRISQQNSGDIQQTAAGSQIITGGGLGLNAGQNISLLASMMTAGETLRIGGEAQLLNQISASTQSGFLPKNLMVGTIALTNESWSESYRGLRGPVANIVKALALTAPGLILATAGLESSGFTTSVKNNSRLLTKDEAASGLSGNNINIQVSNNAVFIAADLSANEKVSISGRNIVLDAAERQVTLSEGNSKETTKLQGMKFSPKKGELRIAGTEITKVSQQSSQTEISFKGSSINAGQLILKADNNINILASEVAVSGDATLEAGNQLTIAGREAKTVQEHRDSTDITTMTIGVRNGYVDAALAVKALADAKSGVDDAKNALNQAKDRVSRGELDAGDLKYFEMNVAAAAANMVQAEIAMAAALAAAAQGAAAAGTGFYATASATHEKTETSTTNNQGNWQAARLEVGGSALLSAGDEIQVEGSELLVNEALFLQAKDIELLAGNSYDSSSMKTKKTRGGISISSRGSGGINAGMNNGDEESRGKTYNNSKVMAGLIVSESDILRLSGAVMEGDVVDVTANKFTIESKQDTYNANSYSTGLNVGVSAGSNGISGANAGASFQKTEAERRWVGEQSGIIGHGEISVKAKDTLLKGGLIANATRNDNGNLIDQGNLQFSTDSLTIEHVYDVDKTKTIGGNLAAGFNLGDKDDSHGQGKAPLGNTSTAAASNSGKASAPVDTVTIGAIYTGHITERTTYATLGGGNIVVGGQTLSDSNADELGLATLNRDVSNAQEITRDQDIGGLNASVTVDGRWFTSAGRAEMAQQQKDIGKNAQLVVDAMGRDLEIILPDQGSEGVRGSIRAIANFIGLPTEENNGGLLSKAVTTIGFIPIHGGTTQQRDIDDVYALQNPDLFALGRESQGYGGLEGPGKEMLGYRVVTPLGFNLTLENSTQANGINGMLNPPANAYVNILEQTTAVGVDNIRSHAGVTNNYSATNGGLADLFGSIVQFTNILFNEIVPGPIDYLTDINLRFSLTGEGKQAIHYLKDLRSSRGYADTLIALHSRGNQDAMLALQVLGKDFFPQSNGNPVFQFAVNGSPVYRFLEEMVIERTGGGIASFSCNTGDQICEGVGGGRDTYVGQKNMPGFLKNVEDFVKKPISLLNISSWLSLGNEKYQVYVDKLNNSRSFTKQGENYESSNDISSHSGYVCRAGSLCGDAFGGSTTAIPPSAKGK